MQVGRQVNTPDDSGGANSICLSGRLLPGTQTQGTRKLTHLYHRAFWVPAGRPLPIGRWPADHIDLIKWYFIANTCETPSAHVRSGQVDMVCPAIFCQTPSYSFVVKIQVRFGFMATVLTDLLSNGR